MTTRKHKRSKLKEIRTVLTKDAVYNQSDDTYTTKISINHKEYTMKFQFADIDRIIVWNAVETSRKNDGQYTVITDDTTLTAILDILLWQNRVKI